MSKAYYVDKLMEFKPKFVNMLHNINYLEDNLFIPQALERLFCLISNHHCQYAFYQYWLNKKEERIVLNWKY